VKQAPGGQHSARGLRLALVHSAWNGAVVDGLLSGAREALLAAGAAERALGVFEVPGAFELPLAARAAARSRRFDAVIALGAVIRGSTPHFDYVAGEVSKGIAQVMLETGVPVAFGIITADTIEQAIERAGTKSGNKGQAAAMSAIEMARVLAEI
jgi:6,7-dimethyl-8-ribityllumazine synthase